MPEHARSTATLTALTALAVTGLTLGTVLTVPAGAAAPKAPGFLAAKDLPPHTTSTWSAGRVTAGVPEVIELDTCLGMVLGGGSSTWHREFWTDLDTTARQVSVKASTVGAAKGRYARVDKDIKSCAKRIERTSQKPRRRSATTARSPSRRAPMSTVCTWRPPGARPTSASSASGGTAGP
ncbi:hypothetical protein [Streptomyces antibioticus]|uniref:hypothetical protein n=1 Tax=Streptomyces antibioticus TaxID=1890 RepID=UPI0033EC0D50